MAEEYYLRAPFTASNYTFSDTDDVETEAPGSVIDGTLTVDNGTGSMAIVSNSLECTSAVLNSSVYSQAISREFGQLWKYEVYITSSAANTPTIQSKSSTTDISDFSKYREFFHTPYSFDDRLRFTIGDGIASINEIATHIKHTTFSTSDTLKLAVLTGGFNSSGVPYNDGDTKTDFKYGTTSFYHDGTNWLILARNEYGNTDPLYASIAAGGGKVNEILIAKTDANTQAMMVPSHLDLFTDSDSTDLNAHTMDTGPGWTDQVGTLEIQSNEVSCDSSIAWSTYTFDAGITDRVIECKLTPVYLNGSNASISGIIFRFVDTNNFMYARMDARSNTFAIVRRVTGSWTTLASTGVTGAGNVEGVIRIVISDGVIKATYNGLHELATTDTNFDTSTICGLEYQPVGASCPSGSTFEDFVVYPTGADGEHSVLDNYRATPSVYELRAPFTATNNTFADGDDVETEAPGSVSAGALSVIDLNSSVISLASNEITVTSGATGESNAGLQLSSVTRELGLLFRSTLTNSVTGNELNPLMYAIDTATQTSTDPRHYIGLYGGEVQINNLFLNSYSAATGKEVAMIIGGYNSAGEPWTSIDNRDDYKYGFSAYALDGTNWLLLYKSSLENFSSIYFGIKKYSASSIPNWDNMVVHGSTTELRGLLTPDFYDAFVDTDNTALSSHDPDIGGAWVHQNGSFEIVSNKLVIDTYSGTGPASVATVDVSEADLFISADLTCYRTDASNYDAISIVFRYVDDDNFWMFGINPETGLAELYRRVTGSWSSIDTSNPSVATATSYNVQISVIGDDIVCNIDGDDAVSTNDSAHNTATEVGVRYLLVGTAPSNASMENLHLYPSGDGGEYSDIDLYSAIDPIIAKSIIVTVFT